jgi:hypothetical protein
MGAAISVIMLSFGYGSLTPVGSIGVDEPYLIAFLNGLFSSGGVWLTHTIQEAFERHHQK